MKKLVYTLIGLSVLFSGCKKKDEDGASGSVTYDYRLEMVETITSSGMIHTTTFTFDTTNSRYINMTTNYTDSWGQYQIREDYTYEVDGTLIQKDLFSLSGNSEDFVGREKYAYNINGNIIEREEWNVNSGVLYLLRTTTTNYNLNGYRSNSTTSYYHGSSSSSFKDSIHFYYDSNNNIIADSVYNTVNCSIGTPTSLELTYYSTYQTENGRIVLKDRFSSHSGMVQERTEYTYSGDKPTSRKSYEFLPDINDSLTFTLISEENNLYKPYEALLPPMSPWGFNYDTRTITNYNIWDPSVLPATESYSFYYTEL